MELTEREKREIGELFPLLGEVTIPYLFKEIYEKAKRGNRKSIEDLYKIYKKYPVADIAALAGLMYNSLGTGNSVPVTFTPHYHCLLNWGVRNCASGDEDGYEVYRFDIVPFMLNVEWVEENSAEDVTEDIADDLTTTVVDSDGDEVESGASVEFGNYTLVVSEDGEEIGRIDFEYKAPATVLTPDVEEMYESIMSLERSENTNDAVDLDIEVFKNDDGELTFTWRSLYRGINSDLVGGQLVDVGGPCFTQRYKFIPKDVGENYISCLVNATNDDALDGSAGVEVFTTDCIITVTHKEGEPTISVVDTERVETAVFGTPKSVDVNASIVYPVDYEGEQNCTLNYQWSVDGEIKTLSTDSYYNFGTVGYGVKTVVCDVALVNSTGCFIDRNRVTWTVTSNDNSNI